MTKSTVYAFMESCILIGWLQVRYSLLPWRLDQLPIPRGRSRDEMVVVVTPVSIALVALMGVIVTEGFDWFVGFLATGRVFFEEGRGLGGPGERCVDMYNYIMVK